ARRGGRPGVAGRGAPPSAGGGGVEDVPAGAHRRGARPAGQGKGRAMKNLGQMLKQAQELQAKMGEMQAKLANMEVEGFAGGGMVSLALNGKGEMRRLKLEPSLLNPAEAEVLEDLIVAAHNDAKSKLEQRL